MGELHESMLKQQLQKEIDTARSLEAAGKMDAAQTHYNKAASIYRILGFKSNKEKATELFDNANRYEGLGKAITSNSVKESIDSKDTAEIQGMIDSLIITQKPDTKWDDIGNLEEAKAEIKESIILPFIKDKPDFVRSVRTILLYGPPGTGKTLLAKASSNTLDATFFEAKASALLSKYYGESAKLVTALFTKAREKQPSLVFMDELDSVVLSRDMQVNEATRRVIGQLLSEIDGFNTKKDDKVIFMGATNKPWDLDDAMLSRFQRKIYIPLPDERARKIIFQIHLKGSKLENTSAGDLAAKTENFSGRDIATVCQDAISEMVREQNPGLQDLTMKQIDVYKLKYRTLTEDDFKKSFVKIKPAASKKELDKFSAWKEEFGG